jgi:hypothetical protein
MTIEKRISELEDAIKPVPEGPVRIRVVYVPGDIPEAEKDAWIEAHPECVGRIIEVDPIAGTRVVYRRPDAEGPA